MKIIFLMASIFCLLLVGGVYVYNEILIVEVDPEIKNNCPNFNGKQFLLTGGTGIPETYTEINNEIGRLNKLCGRTN